MAFKQDNGVFRPPSFEMNSKKLMILYRLRIERYTVEKIIAEALTEIATFKFQPETVPVKARDHFLSFARPLTAKTKMAEVL
jgi:hypothetical protein